MDFEDEIVVTDELAGRRLEAALETTLCADDVFVDDVSEETLDEVSEDGTSGTELVPVLLTAFPPLGVLQPAERINTAKEHARINRFI